LLECEAFSILGLISDSRKELIAKAAMMKTAAEEKKKHT
jgi:hypothetical protein